MFYISFILTYRILIENKCMFSEELDLTGSPLKLDLSLHTILDDTLISEEAQLWNKEEASHVPISIEKLGWYLFLL